jgi:dipeptidase E
MARRGFYFLSRSFQSTVRLYSSLTTLLIMAASPSRSLIVPSPLLRGVFVGSGSDGMSDPRMADVILDLSRRRQQKQQQSPIIHVLYLGTATYDLPQFRKRQTQWFAEQHACQVSTLELVHHTPTPEKVAETIDKADIIVVGGGNTLFAVDRWKAVPQVVPSLQAAMERGAILTGGSAGAICWFDGGHSDSMDPDTYYNPMIQKFGDTCNNISNKSATTTVADESSSTTSNNKDWKYIRVSGLGFLPGLLCPHHDRIQSNGVLRAHDFDQMLLQHPGELGIGIDHWAALVVENDSYRVVSLEDKPGSVLYNGDGVPTLSQEAKGVPGIWIKHVQEGKVVAKLLPSSGNLSEVLLVRRATDIVQDREVLEQCRRDNPDRTKVQSS